MPFSPAVRKEALIASARHCSVCHRYKGVKVEVHHIVPESEGGSNGIENAIVLCFDCHADAGHYNSKHPRGKKMSPEELREAKDIWQIMVQGSRIEPPEFEDVAYCRYLLCRSFTGIKEVCAGNLSSIPVPDPLLVNNQVIGFQRNIVKYYSSSDRGDQIWGDSFANVEAYSRANPDVRVFERSSFPYYPYFRAIRIPPLDEIEARVSPSDHVSQLLTKSKISPNEICRAMAYDELCGDGCFQEIYYLRPFWALYLEFRNLSNVPIKTQFIEATIENHEGIGFRPFLSTGGLKSQQKLPLAPILPGQSILVPLASLLGPLDMNPPEGTSHVINDVETGQVQRTEHADYSSVVRHAAIIGPAIWPHRFQVQLNELPVKQPVHEFDLSNLYTIDRSWMCGSCPHLFFIDYNGQPHYQGELFAKTPFMAQTYNIVMPPNVQECIVAELESERTFIEGIYVNGLLAAEDRKLDQGEKVIIGVSNGDQVTFHGRYEPKRFNLSISTNPVSRNNVIFVFMNQFKQLTCP